MSHRLLVFLSHCLVASSSPHLLVSLSPCFHCLLVSSSHCFLVSLSPRFLVSLSLCLPVSSPPLLCSLSPHLYISHPLLGSPQLSGSPPLIGSPLAASLLSSPLLSLSLTPVQTLAQLWNKPRIGTLQGYIKPSRERGKEGERERASNLPWSGLGSGLLLDPWFPQLLLSPRLLPQTRCLLAALPTPRRMRTGAASPPPHCDEDGSRRFPPSNPLRRPPRLRRRIFPPPPGG